MILELTVVTQVGVRSYRVGDKIEGREVVLIKLGELYFTGDPYSQYLIYGADDKLIASVCPMCPHTVDYL